MRSVSLAVAFVGMVLVVAGCGGGGGSGSQDPGTQAGNTEPTGGTERQGTEDEEATETDSGSSQSITGDGGSVSQSNKVSGSSSSSSSSQTSSGGNGLRSFSGQGESNLTFNVERPSRLSWTNDEDETFSARGGGINIDSRRGRGEIELAPGRYEDVKVRGATWTIIVRPR